MRIPIAAWTIYDWKGGDNVSLRVTANQTFVARENDGTGRLVEASANDARVVACTVTDVTVDGLPTKALNIPATWLYSTNDALTNRQATYNASIVRGNKTIEALDMLQDFKVLDDILALGNPTTWYEIIRSNNGQSPIPIDRTTYSAEQLLELFQQYVSIPRGLSALSTRVAYWGVDDHTLNGATVLNWDETNKRLTLSDGQLRAIQTGTNIAGHFRAAAAGAARVLQVTDSLDAELFGVSRTTAGFAAALTTTFAGPTLFNGAVTASGGVTFQTTPVVFNIGADFNNAVTMDGGVTFTTVPVVFNIGADFNNAVTMDGGVTFTTAPVVFNIGADFNSPITIDAQSDFSALARFANNVQFGVTGVGSSAVIFDDNAVGTSDLRAIDNAQGIRLFATNTFGNNDGGALEVYGNAHANTGLTIVKSGSHASALLSLRTAVSGSAVERQRLTALGEALFTSGVRTTGGATPYFRIQAPADTTLTADTEAVGIQLGGSSVGGSVTRGFTAGGGSFTLQREVFVPNPTYQSGSAETIAQAATFAIGGSPAVAGSMVITQAMALWSMGGLNRFDGNVIGSQEENVTIDVDASAIAGVPALRMSLHPTGQPTQIGLWQIAQTSSFGTRSMINQLTPDQTAGYAVFEGFSALGTVIHNNNNTNPVLIYVNGTEVGRHASTGLMTITGPSSGTGGFIALVETGDGTPRFRINNDGLVEVRAGNGATPSTPFRGDSGILQSSKPGLDLGTGTITTNVRTVEANVMGLDGDWIEIHVFGRLINAANKTVTLFFNGVTTGIGTGALTNTGYWEVHAYMYRENSTTVSIRGYFIRANTILGQGEFFSGSVNWGTAMDIAIQTVNAGATGDITLDRVFIVKHTNHT